jgi:nonribosomal peptide synthetase DhbF
LSSAQQRMWFLNRLEKANPAYNILFAVRLAGPLDAATLHAALADVVERRESLRTIFPETDGNPWQDVLGPAARRAAVAVTAVSEKELTAVLAQAVGRRTPPDVPLVALTQDEIEDFEAMAAEAEMGRGHHRDAYRAG